MHTLHRQPGSGQFRKDLLPSPRHFCERQGIKLTRSSRRHARGACPIHGGKNPTAFSINIDTGAAHCFNCAFKCGDVVGLAMALWRCGFVEACKRLGAWEEVPPLDREERDHLARRREQERRRRDRIEQAAARLECDERRLRLQVRAKLRAVEQRILALIGDPQGQDVVWWGELATAHEQQLLAVVAYHILAFSSVAERARFVRSGRDARLQIAREVINRGYVINEDHRAIYFDLECLVQATTDERSLPWSLHE